MATDIRPAPGWAVVCAWLVPLAILPSAIWRLSLLAENGSLARNLLDGGWYLLLLSVLSVGLGLLTLGLVRPWGTRLPRWMPVWGGRVLPARVPAVVAGAGAIGVIALQVYGIVNSALGLVHPAPLVDTGFLLRTQAPGWGVLVLYLPLALWGPLVLVLAGNYARRRRSGT